MLSKNTFERPQPGERIKLIKCNIDGEKRMSYRGWVKRLEENSPYVDARWTETNTYDHFSMRRGDPVTECFFFDRWYNVLTLFDGVKSELRGFYCDIIRPPVLLKPESESWMLKYIDLTLDLFIDKHGKTHLVDSETFKNEMLLQLSPEARAECLKAVAQLVFMAELKLGPFHHLEKRR